MALAALWWAPAILLAVAALLLDRARAAGTLLVDALRALGLTRAARAVCLAAMRRCERRRAALRGGRG